jgi:hypothetical protein
MIYVANAFSLGMISPSDLPNVRFAPIQRPVLDGLQWTSAVGHADTAALLGVPMARITVALKPGDTLYVAQLQGPRLPEGTTVLPAGSSFAWVAVTIVT